MNAKGVRGRKIVESRITLILLLVTVLLSAAGCSVLTGRLGSSEESSSSPGYEGPGVPGKAPDVARDSIAGTAELSAVAPNSGPEATSGQSSDALAAEKQLMIRTANMRIQVKDVDASIDRLRTLTKEFGGLVESLQVSSQEDVPIYRPADVSGSTDVAPLAAYATVRVPQERFDAFLARVSSLGKVLVQSESGQDVTQQHIDLSARLTTLRAEEARLREFLASAKTVQDMLAVERELSRVRSEIESMQAQLDYLDKQIAMSALSVELVRPTPVVQPSGTDWGFADALRNGIRGAAALLTGMITVTISVLPLLVVVGIVIVVWVALVRSNRRHRLAGEAAGHSDELGVEDRIGSQAEDQSGQDDRAADDQDR